MFSDDFGTLSKLRISENEHKNVIEDSPADSRVVVCPDCGSSWPAHQDKNVDNVDLNRPEKEPYSGCPQPEVLQVQGCQRRGTQGRLDGIHAAVAPQL